MKPIAAISTSLCWTVLFVLVGAFALFAAEDGAAQAIALFGLPLEASAVETLPGRAVMGGLCFGAAVVAAMFATVGLSIAMSSQGTVGHTRFLVEMAHGGAFGIAGLVVLLMALSGSVVLLGAGIVTLALLVASLIGLRAALAEPTPEAVPSPIVARQMATAAASNVNVVRFPFYRVEGSA